MPSLNKLSSVSGEKIRNVPARLHIFAIFIYLRIEVRSLSFKTHPPIKTRARGVVVSHVPLAYESGCVTRLSQQQRKSNEFVACCRTIDIVSDPVSVWILARQKTGARRRAKRRSDECISEECAFAANAIDIGRLDEWMTGNTQIIPTQIINENKNNIGPSLLLTIGLRRTHQCKDRQQQCARNNYKLPHRDCYGAILIVPVLLVLPCALIVT